MFTFFNFFPTKSDNRKAEQVLQVGGLGSAPAGGGRWWGKGYEDEYGAHNV
jgi:hypothetical protein